MTISLPTRRQRPTSKDEASSAFFSMLREAIQSGGVTYILPLASIAPGLRRLVTLGAGAGLDDGPPVDL